MTDPTPDRKADLRADMRAQLARLSSEERHAASVAACARLATLECFQHASVVMLYMPLVNEVDITPLAIRCFQLGKTVCVPKVDWERRDMTPVEVTSFDDRVMDIDAHGLRVPRGTSVVVPGTIDLVVVPGLAYDPQGHRLGRGGGYYDRFLSRLRRSANTVGIAFDIQVIEPVPAGAGDVSVDILVTDRRVTVATQRSRR
jgi:5-formyltetrahydrofolate cyclo-ligase